MNKKSDHSFESINYSLRPNKVIARKLIFESLRRLSVALNLGDYRYIGMGSVWFVDVGLAHRVLRIGSLISIEASDIGFRRALFNAPYACVKVKHGYTADILPTLKLAAHRNIVWLDHDTGVDGPAINDVQVLVDECSDGSIFLVTVNANIKELKRKIDPQRPDGVLAKDVEQFLVQHAGDNVPRGLTETEIEEDQFPTLVLRILESAIGSSLRFSGRTTKFVKLFDLVYRDGPAMATIGGLIGSGNEARAARRAASSPDWPGIVSNLIQAPPLTLKEKMSLDRMLPRSRRPSEALVRKRAGFPLKRAQIESYFRHYASYPTFAEFQL
jgi:hypothetical protein